MKKLTALILTLVMLVSMTAIVPVSAEAVAFAPAAYEYTIAPGESFTVTWDFEEDLEYIMMEGRVFYDEDAFTASDLSLNYGTYNGAKADAAFEEWDVGLGVMIASDGDSYSYSLSGSFLSVTFTASETASGTYTISQKDFWYTDADWEDQFIEDADITVTVKTPSTLVEDPANLTADAYQIRVPYAGAEETTFGFRFISEVNVENYTAKEFGTLVIPSAKLEGDLTVETADVAKVVAEKFMSETTETFKQYNATMVDIKEANYAVDFTYRPYIVLEDDSIVYGEVATANILETITALYDDLNAEQQAWVAENVPGFNA